MENNIDLSPRGRLSRLLFAFAIFACASTATIAIHAAPFAPDTSFQPPLFARPSPPARALLLPDEKYLLYHSTDTLTDQRTGAITRYLPDGTLDTSFNFSREYKFVSAATPAGNGKIYVAAQKKIYGEQTVREVLRLNRDGSIDTSFTPAHYGKGEESSAVLAFLVQPDGKLLASGLFFNFAGEDRAGIVRLLPNGALDENFRPTETNNTIFAMALQPDGKIVIGGDFSVVNEQYRFLVARLNSDGAVDPSFEATDLRGPSTVRDLRISKDQKIVLSGRMRMGRNDPVGAPLVRLNSDGSRDTSFSTIRTPSTGGSRDIELTTEGKILAAMGGTLYRFNSDGSVDEAFHRPDVLAAQKPQSPARDLSAALPYFAKYAERGSQV